MTHDLVIRNGTLVDGSGRAAHQGDLAITGDTITAVGHVPDTGAREIDAAELLVTPGFVDIHSHLDAQVGWDPLLTPSSNHGITTVLLGNCGVTFAPCKPGDREMLASMMESVEDIPADAILTGLPWTWETYGEYLDALDDLAPAINTVGLVGHCALRPYVMGERGVADVATDDERATMADIVATSHADGAAGFSTSRFPGHFLPDGRLVPGTEADPDELLRIAEAMGTSGLTQVVPNISDMRGELAMIHRIAKTVGGRVLFSTGVSDDPGSGKLMAGIVDRMRADGCAVTGVCIPRASGFVVGLQNEMLWRGGAWAELKDLTFEQRREALDDDAWRARLIADGESNRPVNPPANVYPLGFGVPTYTGGPDDSLQALADATGERPVETYIRLLRESNGAALFTVRFFNRSIDALEDVLTSDWVLPGLGDAGAHVGQIMDAGWTTFVLRYWARERGVYSVEEAVRRMTSAPAEVVGLTDRGTLEVGKRADVNVIDCGALAEQVPEFVHDFPGGAGRFVQGANGYVATVCNGEVILEADQHTGVRPGRVLRADG
jgi:N-acyl-D-aspartate/D-glutamate deacylase